MARTRYGDLLVANRIRKKQSAQDRGDGYGNAKGSWGENVHVRLMTREDRGGRGNSSAKVGWILQDPNYARYARRRKQKWTKETHGYSIDNPNGKHG